MPLGDSPDKSCGGGSYMTGGETLSKLHIYICISGCLGGLAMRSYVTFSQFLHNADNPLNDFCRLLPQILQNLPQITVGSGLDDLELRARSLQGVA